MTLLGKGLSQSGVVGAINYVPHNVKYRLRAGILYVVLSILNNDRFSFIFLTGF